MLYPYKARACCALFARIDKMDIGALVARRTALVEALAAGDGATAAERMIAHMRDGNVLFLDARQGRPS